MKSWFEGQFWKRWGWMQYLLFACVLFMAFTEISTRHNQRIKPVQTADIELIEENIQEFNTMAEQLGQLEKLPPVAEQWAYAKAVAKSFKVKVRYVDNGSGTYRGPLNSWSGVLSGPTGSVLAGAKKLQETVPTYLYAFSINGNNAQITFSVLGSD